MSDIKVYGSVFAPNQYEQWFERFVLARVEDEVEVLSINIRKDIARLNRTGAPRNAWETMDVHLGGHAPLLTLPEGQVSVDRRYLVMAYKVPGIHARIGRARRECVEFAGPTLHLIICSAPAHEHYGIERR